MEALSRFAPSEPRVCLLAVDDSYRLRTVAHFEDSTRAGRGLAFARGIGHNVNPRDVA